MPLFNLDSKVEVIRKDFHGTWEAWSRGEHSDLEFQFLDFRAKRYNMPPFPPRRLGDVSLESISGADIGSKRNNARCTHEMGDLVSTSEDGIQEMSPSERMEE
jgi:hypothetical protein